MTRSSLLYGLLAFVGVGLVGTLPMACSSGGVGDPCIPEDEYDPSFPGFQRTVDNIESRSFQCQTRICLVNHFQGRVSCPLGQPPVDGSNGYTSRICNAPGGGQDQDICDNLPGGDGGDCVQTAPIAEDCSDSVPCEGGATCDSAGHFCHCDGRTAPANYVCNKKSHQFESWVCHKKNNCQVPLSDPSQDVNALNCDSGGTPKDCCVPGTDTPIVNTVCSQCDSGSNRDAAQAVYCSCRCDVADGDTRDPNFNYCDCPTGYECSQIRANLGLGDPQLTGKYCIKNDTAYVATEDTGCTVSGYFDTAVCPGSTQVDTPCSH